MVDLFRVAICLLELHIPGATSLKAKRRVIKSLIQRLRNRFNVSVTEIGNQDLWQRAELGLAVVCHNGAGADSIIETLITYVEQESNIEIIGLRRENY
ncbi:MAG: DUF503 domain-containing protein [Clostridia bacterium]|nr:DUF503 domain-containing protein [Clostridia bacterium]